MKILTLDQIRALDQYTIQHEPIPSIDLMERASKAFTAWFVEIFDTSLKVLICCGPGNNGGDGLAIARLLHEQGYEVEVIKIGCDGKVSTDFSINLERLPFESRTFESNLPVSDVIIDAIFGSGLTRAAEGEFAQAIHLINQSEGMRVAVDMPSGLFADMPSSGSSIVKADFTISFQLPKLSFLLPENHLFVGEWEAVDIGLSQECLKDSPTSYHLIDYDLASSLVKHPTKFDHKGTNGHALIVAGSYGKMGAVVLAGRAAMRAGLGLLTLHIPADGNTIIQTSIPEAMTLPDSNGEVISQNLTSEKYDCIGVGPGLGRDKTTAKALNEMLDAATMPMVIDADALNKISEHRELLQIIPEGSILTPHPKEFQRLVSADWTNDFERLTIQKRLANELKCIVVLKGAHTSIAFPNGEIYFNSSGNAGMAKAGSGDVLTGIITSLLAQSYTAEQAAILGIFLHGLAGDLAAEQLGEIAMMAGDIIDYLPDAYQALVN